MYDSDLDFDVQNDRIIENEVDFDDIEVGEKKEN